MILVGLYTNYFPTAAYFFGCLLGSNIACGTLIAWYGVPNTYCFLSIELYFNNKLQRITKNSNGQYTDN